MAVMIFKENHHSHLLLCILYNKIMLCEFWLNSARNMVLDTLKKLAFQPVILLFPVKLRSFSEKFVAEISSFIQMRLPWIV